MYREGGPGVIIEFIMNILKSFFLFVIGLFPALPDMTGLAGSVAPVAQVLGAVDHFVDLGVVAACVAALFVFANVEFIWGVIMWVIRKIPGVE
jgi:hypothetical protein